MILSKKVQEILVNLGENNIAKSSYLVNIISERFYNHFKSDTINHVPIKQFIINEVSIMRENLIYLE